ncbi:MAG: exodeoxyribonuclease VII large subunit [Anaerolineales bacterium]|nr:exodeoxyribonuclease VII large subunit [Anaerolineales bacterium]
MGFLRKSTEWGSDAWSVTELTHYIRDLFEVDFRLQDVEVSGEISNFTRARSGHLYFTLKDEQAQLKCVMWRSAAERLQFLPQDGDAVTANGRISVYEAGGVYQLYAEHLEPAGRGDLAVAFEQLKQRLTDEGLFDPAHKKPIPTFPRKIGIVTSADAAALRDMLNVLRRRYPLVSVLIAPTLVQGQQAPPQIVQALRWLDGRDDIDTIIVARGGGSIEDLWAFNDETVARAIFAADHPVISGVGHETDFTIADFVADLRAPTPSAAAELAVPDIEDIQAGLSGLQSRLVGEVTDRLAQERWRLQSLLRTMQQLSPQRRVETNRQRLDGLTIRLDTAVQRTLSRLSSRLAVAQASLQAVSPQATLARGYAIVRNENGRIVRSVQHVAENDLLTVQVADGKIETAVQTRKLDADLHD